MGNRNIAIVFWGLMALYISTSVCASIPQDLLNIYSTIYSTRHGLPSNHVNHIEQDDDGRIWICTQQGVASYNGHDVQTYPFTENKDKSVNYNVVKHDSRGRIWVGTSMGASFIDHKELVTLPVNWTGQSPPSISTIVEDGQHRIWALCNYSELCRLDDRSLKKPKWENQPEKCLITRIRESEDGSIWIGTNHGMFRMINSEVTISPLKTDMSIFDFDMDTVNSGWCLDEDGRLYRFQSGSLEQVAKLPEIAARTAYDMDIGNSGEVWIATLRGLFLWHKNELTNFKYRNGLASNVIMAVFVDREGCLWYGSDNGLGKIAGLTFRRLMPSGELPLSSVSGICQDNDGNIWFATNEGLLQINDYETRSWKMDDGILDESIYSVQPYRDGVAMTNTYGLFAIDKAGKVKRLADDRLGTFTALTVRDETIWLVAEEGLFKYTESDGLESLNHKLPVPLTTPVNSVFFDSTGSLWIATDGQGVFVSHTGDLDKLESVIGLPSPRVFSISESANKTIWIGTLQGLCNLKGNKVQQIYDSKQGLISEDIWTVQCDGHNGIWVSTSRGISSILNGKIYNFDYNDGLSGEDFIANCRFVDSLGRLWFGGMGITVVDPSEKRPLSYPLTRFRYARVNGMPLKNGQEISSGRNTFEFGMMCSSYRNETLNRFRYQLIGYDEYRSSPTQTSEIRYTNLSAGNYILSVESSNRDGRWSAEPVVFEFTVLPAWYQRKVVWLLSFLVFLLLMRLIVRFRSYQLAKTTNRLQEEVHRQTRVIQKQMERLEAQKNLMERQSKIDDLTKLFNRRHFYRKLRDEWIMRRIEGTSLSLVIFDLDRFKQINDTYGHQVGDAVLRQVAAAMRSKVPLSGLAARYGGEEIVLMLNNCDLDSAYQIAEEIRDTISNLTIGGVGDTKLKVTVSGGVACRTGIDKEDSPDALIREADKALYKAKAAGRNRIERAD